MENRDRIHDFDFISSEHTAYLWSMLPNYKVNRCFCYLDYQLNDNFQYLQYYKWSEWVIKFNSFWGDSRHLGPYSPYKLCNHKWSKRNMIASLANNNNKFYIWTTEIIYKIYEYSFLNWKCLIWCLHACNCRKLFYLYYFHTLLPWYLK